MALTLPLSVTGRPCVRCATWYSAEEVASGQAFERMRDARCADASAQRWRPICRPCIETAKDLRKGADRWSSKANDARRRHVIRLRTPRQKHGVVAWHDPDLTDTELATTYGWTQPQLINDAKYRYGNGCDYCHRKYKGMGHGSGDITIDIYDPRLPPDYSNTRWCCMTCQRRKGLLSPDKWAIKQRIYRKWDATRAASPEDRGMLF